MTMRRDHFAYLMAPGLYDVFFNWMKEHPPIYPQFMNLPKTSGRKYEEITKISGFGTMPEKAEGIAIDYDDMIQGGLKQYLFKTFGLAFRITEEAYEDELYHVFSRAANALAKSARNCQEIYAHAVLNFAFDTNYIGINAGESLCSVSHALLRGGTQANRPATDCDLSLAAVQGALTRFANLQDEDGMPALIVPKTLIIPPESKFVAREILISEYKPYTANNEINPVKEDGLGYICTPYLTDKDSWFITAAKGDHDMNFWWRRKLKFDPGEDFDSGDMKNKATQRFIAGFGEWRGIDGSSGG